MRSPPPNPFLQKALRLLAQRDYSEQALRRKLTSNCSFVRNLAVVDNEPDLILSGSEKQLDQVIEYCQVHGWLNDERYTEKYIAIQSEKGYGARRIIFKLKEQGISAELIQQLIQKSDIDWVTIADNWVERKLNGSIGLSKKMTVDWQIKIKIQRWLAQRGFYPEEIQAVLKRKWD